LKRRADECWTPGRAIVRETGALEFSRQAAAGEAQRAIDAARALPAGPYMRAV
jgi:octaprenyl-diphosphate synthase